MLDQKGEEMIYPWSGDDGDGYGESGGSSSGGKNGDGGVRRMVFGGSGSKEFYSRPTFSRTKRAVRG